MIWTKCRGLEQRSSSLIDRTLGKILPLFCAWFSFDESNFDIFIDHFFAKDLNRFNWPDTFLFVFRTRKSLGNERTYVSSHRTSALPTSDRLQAIACAGRAVKRLSIGKKSSTNFTSIFPKSMKTSLIWSRPSHVIKRARHQRPSPLYFATPKSPMAIFCKGANWLFLSHCSYVLLERAIRMTISYHGPLLKLVEHLMECVSDVWMAVVRVESW